jgi:hypothetical protein
MMRFTFFLLLNRFWLPAGIAGLHVSGENGSCGRRWQRQTTWNASSLERLVQAAERAAALELTSMFCVWRLPRPVPRLAIT